MRSPRDTSLTWRTAFVREGRPQRYGTQLEKRGEHWEPLLVDDPEGLDARRQAVGLEPITEYLDGARRALG